ncbi:MAG: DNA-binding protein [Oceanospirillaceae bacterium]|nr:DNA-binding protein [Oceanospirillaceae bacterium]
MNQPQTFSDHKIRQTIEALKSDGQNITPWAVQSRLGGGDFLRIQQMIDQFFPHLKTTATEPAPMQFSAQPKSVDFIAESHQSTDIIDKQMPSGIEASMYQMQTTLGQMANQLWNDAASNAENQVRGKLFSAQQAHAEAKQAHVEAEVAKEQMQQTIGKLTAELDVLDVEYKQTQAALESESSQLKDTLTQRDSLLKNVEALESENQTLEQTAFNANIKAAKAEGLAEIVKEQLALAKQSEKQIQKSLDRSEKKVSDLNREMHNTSQSLRDEMRDRQVPLYPQKRVRTTDDSLQAQYPPQEIPPAKDAQPAPQMPQPITPPPAASPLQPNPSTQGKALQDLGHALVMTRAKKVSQAKTRTLSDKLFERKKSQFRAKKK